MARNIDLNKCIYNDCIALNKEGNFDDMQNGMYGYRVFYTVPKSELIASELVRIPENCLEGEIEFTIINGDVDEVLLWTTVIDNPDEDDESITNDEFIYYEGDITLLVNDFNKRKGA